jgi:hypothetical protein
MFLTLSLYFLGRLLGLFWCSWGASSRIVSELSEGRMRQGRKIVESKIGKDVAWSAVFLFPVEMMVLVRLLKSQVKEIAVRFFLSVKQATRLVCGWNLCLGFLE